MVLVTTSLGFFLGARGVVSVLHLCLTLLGVGSATGGAAVLNNYLERDLDAKMVRTRNRALPAGLIEPSRALTFGVGFGHGGGLLPAGGGELFAGVPRVPRGRLFSVCARPLA